MQRRLFTAGAATPCAATGIVRAAAYNADGPTNQRADALKAALLILVVASKRQADRRDVGKRCGCGSCSSHSRLPEYGSSRFPMPLRGPELYDQYSERHLRGAKVPAA